MKLIWICWGLSIRRSHFMEINEIDIILFDTHLVNMWYIPMTLQYLYGMSNHRYRKCLLNKFFLPHLKIKYPHYCPFVKRSHRSHVKSHHKGPVIRNGFQFISPTCYVSYLNNLYIYICNSEYSIYLYHGLLSVRYVASYDRIERQWHVFVQKCKRFIGENINKHFP